MKRLYALGTSVGIRNVLVFWWGTSADVVRATHQRSFPEYPVLCVKEVPRSPWS